FAAFQSDVAYYGANGFVVVWTGPGPSDAYGIVARRYGASMIPGPEFQVNTWTSGEQSNARVGAVPPNSASANRYVVVWQSQGQAGDGWGVFGQRFSATGPLGAEFQVNTQTLGDQQHPHVALDASGDFVVVWEQPDADGIGVFGRRYASNGASQAAVFRVNTF